MALLWTSTQSSSDNTEEALSSNRGISFEEDITPNNDTGSDRSDVGTRIGSSDKWYWLRQRGRQGLTNVLAVKELIIPQVNRA